MRLLLQFAYLQLLDVLTTLAFLLQGVGEANPILRWAMELSGSPLNALLTAKAVAVALGLFCVWRSRRRLLERVNVFYAGLVAYNLVALILASPVLHAGG